MKKKNKWVLVFIGILIVIFISVSAIYFLTKDEEKVKIQVDVVDEINDYGYSLTSLDGEYYKKTFNELKEILNAEEIDREAYAKVVAKLFIIDLYTINTKVNKYDIGGDIYYHSSKRSEYNLKVVEQFYNLLEDNTYGDRQQELPVVNNIAIVNYQIGTYKLYADTDKEQEVSSYEVELEWSYEKDLGYDTKGKVILVDNGEKIEVVEYNPET